MEGLLKLKGIRCEKLIDELKQERDKYERGLNRTQDEISIGNGLTNKSTLQVTVFRGIDFVPGGLGSSCDSFLSLNLLDEKGNPKPNEKQDTNLIIGKTNPTWNENFKFSIQEPNLKLKIEGFVNGLVGSTSLGEITFDLNDLRDMKPHVDWFDFTENGVANGKGKVFLKAQFVYNMRQFYSDQISSNDNLSNSFSNILSCINYALEGTQTPFGLIESGKLNYVYENNLLKVADEQIEEYEKRRTDLFAYKKYEQETPMNLGEAMGNIGKNIKDTFSRHISWDSFTQVLMVLLLVFAFLSLLARTDFVNFTMGIVVWILYFYDRSNMKEKANVVTKYLKPFIYALGGTLGYDIFWLLLQFNGFCRPNQGDPDGGLKQFTYWISFFNVIVKIILLIRLYSLKQKKENSNAGEA